MEEKKIKVVINSETIELESNNPDLKSLINSVDAYLNGKFSYVCNELTKYHLFFKTEDTNTINITNKENKNIGSIKIEYKDNRVIYAIEIYEYGIKTFKNYQGVSKYIQQYKNHIKSKN